MTESESNLPHDVDPSTPEERRAFRELGLEPCDWNALDAVPLLQMAWRDGRLDPQEVERIRPAVRAVLNSGQTEPWERAARRQEFYDGLTRDGAARPIEQERLSRAGALLAWHLSRHYRSTERTAKLIRLREEALERMPRRQAEWVDAVLAELLVQIDAYLATPSFTEIPQPADVPEPDVADLGLADLQDWKPLLVVPLTKLLWTASAPRTALLRSVQEHFERELDQEASPLRGFFYDNSWLAVLGWLCAAPAEEGNPPTRLAVAQARLAQGLATVPYAARTAALDTLTSMAIQSAGRPLWSLNPAATREPPVQWKLLLDDLRTEVEDWRLRAAVDAAARVAPPPLPPAEAECATAATAPEVAPAAPSSENAEPVIVRPTSFEGIGWSDVWAQAADIDPAQIEALLDQPLLFEAYCAEGERVCVVPADAPLPESLWFVGDLHGDLLAMANIWRYAQTHAAARGQAAHLVFLGDFIDRGQYGSECLALLFRMIRDNPGQIGMVIGNHDEAALHSPEKDRFRSSVLPSETVEQWNAAVERDDPQSRRQAQLGRLACQFFARRSCALFLPDGLLVAHGGFPHEDMLDGLQERADLSRRFCPQDFVWLRYGDAEFKYVYRGSKGCEFGYENFTAFCKVATGRLGIPVERLLRGHDHHSSRYQFALDGPNPIITLNAMCRKLADESGSERYPNCCAARFVPGKLPEIHIIPVPGDEIAQAYYAD